MNQDKKITAGAFAITVLVTLPLSGIAVAETPVSETDQTATSGDFVVDISNWKCEDCAFEEGLSAELELGIGNVSDSSFKFGEYNGLYEEGSFFIANGKARYRGENANYYDLSVEDLGLDSRSIDIEGGRQGRYKAFFRYDEINHAISDSIMTPYIGNGSDTLTLPAGWITGDTTSGMTNLAASLQNHDIELKRKRMDLGFSFIQKSSWKYDLKYRHETREGTKRSAGGFFYINSNAAQLIEPVDYVTDEIDASASYIGERWQATLAYYGSFFSNENNSLTWDNPFTPLTGADTGQRALAPDNLFHQLILSAGYQISDKTRLSGDISIGRMIQDEDFLPATINSSLVVPALPQSSADAEIATMTADIRVISALSDKLRLNASYNYSDHDNQTPQLQYPWVHYDSFGPALNANQPYSFTRQETRLGGDYRFSRATKLSAGLDLDNIERTLQEVENTTEITGWGKVIVRGKDFMDMTFKVAQTERIITNYQPDITPSQNPLLRKYNMADKSRSTAGVTVNAMLSETFSVGGGIDYANDDYSESTLGLIDASEINLNADASAILTENSSFHAFISQERIESSQNGSDTFSNPTWFAENDDTVNTFGIGYKHRLMEDRLDLGLDYVISQSTGKINITTTASEDFPDLEVDLSSIKLYADYRMKNNMSVHAAYWYESYDTKNWALDDVNPDTIDYVLGFGELTPTYDVSVVTVSLRYKF